MRKSLVALIAVAIVGALGVYSKSHSSQTAAHSAKTNSANTSPAAPGSASGASYKDGTYTGSSQSTPYGDVQIAVEISRGRITGINFLQMPDSEGHSREVTIGSEPLLKQQTLQNQNGHVDFVTGATSTSEGYKQSLQAALNQAA